jgi:hypothetical protein
LTDRPIIKPLPQFRGIALIDTDVYSDVDGHSW